MDGPGRGVTVTRYADATAAHDAADGDQDRASTCHTGTTVALVQVAQTDPVSTAGHVATDVVGAVS